MNGFFKKFKEKHTPISVVLWCVAAFALLGCVGMLLALLTEGTGGGTYPMFLLFWFIVLLVAAALATICDKLSSINNSLKKQNEEKNN